MRVSSFLAIVPMGGLLLASAAVADTASPALEAYAETDKVVLAVEAGAHAAGGAVRLTVFESEKTFLEQPASKHQAIVNEDGVAVIALADLEAGDYAFAAYYDRNGDGKLNRNFVGAPKEPVAFSNGFKPKLRKPTFSETKVDVAPGALVVISLGA